MSIPTGHTTAETTNAKVHINAQQASQQVAVAQQQAQQQIQIVAVQPQPQPAIQQPQPTVQRAAMTSAPSTSGGTKKSNKSSNEASVYGNLAAEALGVGAVQDMVSFVFQRNQDAAEPGLSKAQAIGLAGPGAKTADDFFGLSTMTSALGLGGKGKKPADDKGIHLCGSATLAGQSLGSQGACVKSWGIEPTGITKNCKQVEHAMTLKMANEKEFGFAQREMRQRQELAHTAGLTPGGMGSQGHVRRTDIQRWMSVDLNLKNGPKAPSEKMLSDTTSSTGTG